MLNTTVILTLQYLTAGYVCIVILMSYTKCCIMIPLTDLIKITTEIHNVAPGDSRGVFMLQISTLLLGELWALSVKI